jgi:hypothetical protein
MAHGTRGWTVYSPSTAGWTNMSLKVDAFTAANNGTGYFTVPPTNNFWPLPHKNLRFVYGIDSTKARDSCVACLPTGSLFTLGASFSDEFGNSYTVNGLRQERFSTRSLK